MEGTVHAINPEQGLVAVDTPAGFTIFEQTAPDFEIGDFVDWSPSQIRGAGNVRNVSRDRTSRVYFQNHRVPAAFLKVNLHP